MLAKKRLVRAVTYALILTPLVFAAIVGGFALHDYLAALSSARIRLRLLETTRAIYLTLVAAALLAGILAPILIRRARRRQRPITPFARAWLFALSTLVGCALAEAVCTWKQAHDRQTRVMPVGGLESELQSGKTWRFAQPTTFPTLPTRFSDANDARTIDILVVGESSAEGVPFAKWFSIGKLVGWGLAQVMPGRPISYLGVAESGHILERQHDLLTGLKRRPELFIIYCGHNEFTSRLWWSRDLAHYTADQIPSVWQRLRTRLEQTSSVLGLIEESASACRIALPPKQGQRDLVDVPLYTQVEYQALLADFERRLDALVDYALAIGAIPVLVAPPGNDAGFEPNRSYLPRDTPRWRREEFEARVLEARALEKKGDLQTSISRYRALVKEQPMLAECHFRLARLLEQLGEYEEAYREYIAARDRDGYPMRMLTSFQDAYRKTARRTGCLLVDGQELFHAIGRHGQLDNLLFQDAMHPSLPGHVALAQAVLDGLTRRQALNWPAGACAPTLDLQSCLDHFGFRPEHWIGICKWTSGFYNLISGLRFDQSERARKEVQYKRAQKQLEEGTPAEDVGLDNIGVPRGLILRPRTSSP